MKNKNLDGFRIRRNRNSKRKLTILLLAIVIGTGAITLLDAKAQEDFDYLSPVNEVVKKEELTVPERIRQLAKEAGMTSEQVEYTIRLAWCESRFDVWAINANAGSIDRGVFQWNNKYQPQITSECAFNLDCASKAAIKRILQGDQDIWVCNKIIK